MSILTVKELASPAGFDLQMPASAMIDGQALTAYRSEWPSRKNIIINGGFDVWQRGTSGGTVNTYLADRWESGGGGALSQDRQVATSGDDFNYSLRVQRPSTETHGWSVIGTTLEELDSLPLRGKTLTFSCLIKVGANYSPTSSQLGMGIGSSTIANRSWRYLGNVTEQKTVTTSWVRYSVTVTIPTDSKQVGCGFVCSPTGTAGADDWFEIANAQLEVGSTATDFEHRSYGEELALCQRYYQKYENTGNINSNDGALFNTCAWGTTSTFSAFVYINPMRTSPSVGFSDTTANSLLLMVAGSATTPTSWGINNSSDTRFEITLNSSSLTAGEAGWVRLLANKFMYLDAEL